MMIDHEVLTGFSKSFGLFYLIAMSIGVLVYTFWPSNRKPFERAANAVVSDEEDRPCQ